MREKIWNFGKKGGGTTNKDLQQHTIEFFVARQTKSKLTESSSTFLRGLTILIVITVEMSSAKGLLDKWV